MGGCGRRKNDEAMTRKGKMKSREWGRGCSGEISLSEIVRGEKQGDSQAKTNHGKHLISLSLTTRSEETFEECEPCRRNQRSSVHVKDPQTPKRPTELGLPHYLHASFAEYGAILEHRLVAVQVEHRVECSRLSCPRVALLQAPRDIL